MDQFKKRLGQTILTTNEEVLMLQKNYRILKCLDTKEGDSGNDRLDSMKKKDRRTRETVEREEDITGKYKNISHGKSKCHGGYKGK